MASIHIIGAIIGEFAAMFSAIFSIIYLWRRQVLKQKLYIELNKGTLSLDSLERGMLFCLWLAFISMSAAFVLALPAFLNTPQLGGVILWKIFWASMVCLWYAAILGSRYILGVSTKRLALMSLFGFLLLASTIFGFLFLPLFDLSFALS